MVFDKVKEIIADELSVSSDEIKLETNLQEDLGADSLDAVELVMAIEEEFEIEISDDVAQSMKTVQDIVNAIDNQ
ncbi:acyl carrier protein [Haloplasma contractile]|uniref:Acyl carrier protein n=1 Tax=Haloplasma contractile SSD-17B TaxID=1033810 RepID=U2FET8_9MOLU|nr:acyl carrier protein [Haloplasma contractile]ERJ11455.1 Acyl carrier protein [Haloplasma contractile SSD-17B]